MIKSYNFDINNRAITIDRLKDRVPIDPKQVPWDQKKFSFFSIFDINEMLFYAIFCMACLKWGFDNI